MARLQRINLILCLVSTLAVIIWISMDGKSATGFKSVSTKMGMIPHIFRTKASIVRKQAPPKLGKSWAIHCSNNTAKRRLNEVFFMPSRNLMYCSLPKVGCTFWKRVIGFLNGNMRRWSISDPFKLNKSKVHELPAINYLKNRTMFSNAYRFMFVREPFSRLWSAYVDKIFLPNFWNIYGKTIVRKTRNLHKDAKTCGNDVTFQEFLRFIVLTKNTLESHWSPMSSLCDPCEFKPHFIGRVETFGSDSQFIADKFDLQDTFKLFKGNNIQEMIDQIVFAFMFIRRENITCISKFELTRKLWKAFQYVGHIPRHHSFPEKRVTDEKDLTDNFVISLFMDELSRVEFSKEERHQQKEDYLREELENLPLDVRNGILDVYRRDFEMFLYNEAEYFT